jgi:hypothetical protein
MPPLYLAKIFLLHSTDTVTYNKDSVLNLTGDVDRGSAKADTSTEKKAESRKSNPTSAPIPARRLPATGVSVLGEHLFQGGRTSPGALAVLHVCTTRCTDSADDLAIDHERHSAVEWDGTSQA